MRLVAARAESRMADIHDQLGVEPITAVRASLGTPGLFMLSNAAVDQSSVLVISCASRTVMDTRCR